MTVSKPRASAPAPDGELAGSTARRDAQAERRLLDAVFRQAPVALLVAGTDGTVQRVNQAAAELLRTGSGYATGRSLTALVDLPSRAALDTQLAAVIRTGRTRTLRCDLLSPDGLVPCELTVALARLRGDAEQLVIAARGIGQQAPPPAKEKPKPSRAAAPNSRAAGAVNREVAAMTRRLDLMTAVARLLLEDAPRSEGVVLQRCARLLADELSAWVIVDLARDDQLWRQCVAGGQDERATKLARAVSTLDPRPGSLAWTVHEGRSSQLIAVVQDTGLLGEGPGGVPLLLLLDATSVLSVPIRAGEHAYGTLTLARHARDGQFGLAELGLVEETGEQLALAITMDRSVRRQNQIASALADSLLPRQLPAVPGVEVATSHLAVTGSSEVGGDFFDVYRTADGWGVAIGDAYGRGEGVAAASAAARHAIRVAAHSAADPAAVLTGANEIMLAEEFGGRFVTACAAHMSWQGGSLRVCIASAGHPTPVLVHPDGRVQQVGGGGLPLGLFPDARPSLAEHDLSQGDVLLFHNDGLGEARSPESGYFDERLPGEVAALADHAPAEILTRLQDAALAFCQRQIRDDVTMLALRVGEPQGH